MAKEFTVTFPEDQFHVLANLLQLICIAGLEFHGTGSAIPTKENLRPLWNTILAAAISPTSQANTES